MPTNDTQDASEHWPYGEGLTYFAIFVLVVGLIANVITLLTLTWNGKGFPLMSRSLLRHQSIVDGLVCIMGIGMYSQDPMWMTGNQTFDHLLQVSISLFHYSLSKKDPHFHKNVCLYYR